MSESERVRRALSDMAEGRQSGARLCWDPNAKRIRTSGYPDRDLLGITKEDMDHFQGKEGAR